MNKAIFLDRDGTINEDIGYIKHPGEISLIAGSAEAIKLLNRSGFMVIVISNQSGVARGIFTEDMLQTIDKHLQKELLKRGAYVDAMFYCPHHPEHGLYPFKRSCECRKPGPALIHLAAKLYNIDMKSSYMIGDKATDIEAGHNARIRNILVLTGRGERSRQDLKSDFFKPDHIANDLLDAVKWVLDGKEAEVLREAPDLKLCHK